MPFTLHPPLQRLCAAMVLLLHERAVLQGRLSAPRARFAADTPLRLSSPQRSFSTEHCEHLPLEPAHPHRRESEQRCNDAAAQSTLSPHSPWCGQAASARSRHPPQQWVLPEERPRRYRPEVARRCRWRAAQHLAYSPERVALRTTAAHHHASCARMLRSAAPVGAVADGPSHIPCTDGQRQRPQQHRGDAGPSRQTRTGSQHSRGPELLQSVSPEHEPQMCHTQRRHRLQLPHCQAARLLATSLCQDLARTQPCPLLVRTTFLANCKEQLGPECSIVNVQMLACEGMQTRCRQLQAHTSLCTSFAASAMLYAPRAMLTYFPQVASSCRMRR